MNNDSNILPKPCEIGKYRNNSDMEVCVKCDSGYFCDCKEENKLKY